MKHSILPTPTDVAKRCVNSILIDLTDRRGFRQEWENIDEATQEEIKKEWRNIITVELGGQAED